MIFFLISRPAYIITYVHTYNNTHIHTYTDIGAHTHIHIHLQDQPTFDPATATGLPLEFTDYLADGMSVEHGGPIADQFIGNG